LGTKPGFFILILALTSIVSYYYIFTDGASALTEEASLINGYLEKEKNTAHISYYGSIFSNLSRGLPIVEGVPSTEVPSGEEKDNQVVSANSTVQ
jgi:hypothetical protein